MGGGRGTGAAIAKQIANRTAAGAYKRGVKKVPGTGGAKRKPIIVRNKAGDAVYRV